MNVHFQLCDDFQLTFSYPAELQFKVLVLDLIMDNVDTTVRGREREKHKGEREGGGGVMENLGDGFRFTYH